MSTRPAEITTPYGWAELFDAIRATRAAITWINARIEHYRDLRDGQERPEPAGRTAPADPDRSPQVDAADLPSTSKASAEVRSASTDPDAEPWPTTQDYLDALASFVDARIELNRVDLIEQTTRPEPADPTGDAGSGTEPEKGTEAMHPDEQRRRDALIAEEHEREQRDLQSDGVLDGDENPEPGDGGTADLELEG